MKLRILKSFKFAHDGYRVEEFAEGTEVDTTDACAEVAVAEGWAEEADGEKSIDAAPENKDAAPKRSKKA